jgi:hypothetical protein
MMKSGGWLSKFDTAQSGKTFMDKVDADIAKLLGPNTDKNRSRGDIASYFPQMKIAKQTYETNKALAEADQKRPQKILAEAVARAKGKQETVKQDNRTSREKEIAQQELLNLKMDEAKGKSPFTQTLSSFTPTGSNQAAAQIAAENIGQMTPMMGATRLFTTAMNPENNPYGIGQGNGFLANTLGTLGLIGDALDVGAVTAPGVKAAGKYLTEQTPLKNAHKLNPYALTDDILFNKEGVVNRQIFGDEAFESFKQYGPTTRPGVPEIDKFMEFIKAPRSQIISANDEVFDVVNTMEDGVFKYPYFQEGSLWYTGQQRNNLAKELGKERIITTPKSDIWFAPAGEATLMGGDDLVSKSLIDKYSKGRRVLIPGTEYANPSMYSVFEPHWWKGYKQVPITENVGNTFNSTINWAKWNPAIPKNKSLMEEYINIEQISKANNTWMKNPDGSEFKGTPEQFVQQQSQNFKKAFPNPIRDNSGNIQINYHGTQSKKPFNKFRKDNELEGWYGTGTYTTPDRDYALGYTSGMSNEDQLYQLYINSNNPQKPIGNLFNRNYTKEEMTLQPGYDYLKVSQEQVTPFTNYLKSAIGNNGMFDMNNPNIYKGLLPAIGVAGIAGASQKKNGGWLNKYK